MPFRSSPSATTIADTATIVCTLLTLLNAASGIHTAAAHFLGAVMNSATETSVTGLGWNLTDTASGLAATPGLLRRAKGSLYSHEKMTLALLNAVHFGAVLPGFSAWGFASVIKSVEAIGVKALIYNGGVVLGATAALAGSSFAFAAGMFVNASISGYAWYRALQDDAPYTMMEDKIVEYDELEEKIKRLGDEFHILRQKKMFHEDERLKRENLENKVAILKAKQDQIKHDVEALYAYALQKPADSIANSGKSLETSSLADPSKESLGEPALKPAGSTLNSAKDQKEKITLDVLRITGKTADTLKKSTLHKEGEALIQKQISDKRFDTIANIAGGIGAVLGGLAVLFPPAALPLLAGCAVCFAVCAVMKGIQWYEKREAVKNLNEKNANRSIPSTSSVPLPTAPDAGGVHVSTSSMRIG